MYTVYQREGKNADGTVWKYIGLTNNLKRRLGEHARDYRVPLYGYVNDSATVKTTVLGKTGSRKIGLLAEATAITRTSRLARTTTVVNVQHAWKK